MSKKLKTSLIGFGKMAQSHFKAVKLLDDVEITGVVDPFISEEQLNSTVGGNVKLFKSNGDLFSVQKPDIAHIITPPHTHFNLAKEALINGAHVIIEKPFTLKVNDAQALIDIAIEKNLKISAGHQLLYQKPVKSVEKILNHIGDIIHIESYFAFRTARKSITPVDQLIDILPHPVYSLVHFMLLDLNGTRNDEIKIESLYTSTNGEARALLSAANITGQLTVSLNGRPVDSYLKIIGNRGYIKIDFVRDMFVKISGSGVDAVSAILHPYRESMQSLWRSTKAFAGFAFNKHKNYPGLNELIHEFYKSIQENTDVPISYRSILETVKICSEITGELKSKEIVLEKQSSLLLEEKAKKMPVVENNREKIFLTGGTGFLGKIVAEKLRQNGWPVKLFTRKIPNDSQKIPGVEYFEGDLSKNIDENFISDAKIIIHCAAETAGGKLEHQRNSIDATKILIEAAQKAGIEKFIHISSIAVLKTSREVGGALSEKSAVDFDNLGRGPYVWGKAQSEAFINQHNNENISFKIIRPGPLVDYEDYQPPGRLGREAGSRFIIMGSRNSNLSVCNVHTVADVILYYLNNYDTVPSVLNLVEPEASSRLDLMNRFLENRPDLKSFYVPTFLVNLSSLFLKGVQKILSPTKKPLDIASAFGSEKYDVTLAGDIIQKARSGKA